MNIKDFNIGKGISKFLLGAVAVLITLAIQNPQLITSIIPEKWATMTLAGLVVEILDYLLHKIKK